MEGSNLWRGMMTSTFSQPSTEHQVITPPHTKAMSADSHGGLGITAARSMTTIAIGIGTISPMTPPAPGTGGWMGRVANTPIATAIPSSSSARTCRAPRSPLRVKSQIPAHVRLTVRDATRVLERVASPSAGAARSAISIAAKVAPATPANIATRRCRYARGSRSASLMQRDQDAIW